MADLAVDAAGARLLTLGLVLSRPVVVVAGGFSRVAAATGARVEEADASALDETDVRMPRERRGVSVLLLDATDDATCSSRTSLAAVAPGCLMAWPPRTLLSDPVASEASVDELARDASPRGVAVDRDRACPLAGVATDVRVIPSSPAGARTCVRAGVDARDSVRRWPDGVGREDEGGGAIGALEDGMAE